MSRKKEAPQQIIVPEKEEEVYTPDVRFYEREFPELDECVVIMVTDVSDMGAHVVLLEYANMPGMILLNELSRRRIRSISKHIKVGRKEHVIVTRVDTEKGYIDLSKRKVTPEDIEASEERFIKAKTVNSIVYRIAKTTSHSMMEINQRLTWPLARMYGSAYDGLKLAMNDPEKILGPLQLEENILTSLKAGMKKSLTPTAVKIRADVEVSCFTMEGIDGVREALLAGLNCGTTDIPIKVILVAPPHYAMLTTTMDKEGAIALFHQAIQAMTQVIVKKGGQLKIKLPPRATSASEERKLQQDLDRAEDENMEVAGDSDEASIGGGEEVSSPPPTGEED